MNIKKINMQNAGSFENWHKSNNQFRKPAELNFVDVWYLRTFTNHRVFFSSMGMTAKIRRLHDRLQWWWHMQDGWQTVLLLGTAIGLLVLTGGDDLEYLRARY